MRKLLVVVTLFATLCSTAIAGPKEDAQAVFDKFLTNFTAADMDGVVGLFWPDAQFWGTRVSVVVTKRGDRWLMSQFHNSPRPKPQ